MVQADARGDGQYNGSRVAEIGRDHLFDERYVFFCGLPRGGFYSTLLVGSHQRQVFLTSEEAREVNHTEVLMLGPGHFYFQDVVGERARRLLGRLTGRWHFHNFGGLVLD